MCLSTIYRDSVEQENLIMKNVRMIEYRDGTIVLANLVEGVALIKEKKTALA